MTPKLTIGLPVFNGERFLPAAIESILAQRFRDFRLIVSDNASTDGTRAIAESFVSRDERVLYHRNETNLGLAANWNLVFRMSESPYFRWATSDDLAHPDFVLRCVEHLDRDPTTVLVGTGTRFIDDAGSELDIHDPGIDLRADDPATRLRQIFEAGSWVNAILGVIRRDALARTGLLPSYSSGDYGLLGELAVQGKFAILPEKLFVRRLHERSSSRHVKELAWMDWYWRGGEPGAFNPPIWERYLHHRRTISRSGLPLRERLGLHAHLMRTMVWRRDRLRRELLRALASRLPRRRSA